jgi:hypothetical protein
MVQAANSFSSQISLLIATFCVTGKQNHRNTSKQAHWAPRPKWSALVPTAPASLQPTCAICLNKRTFLAGKRPEPRPSALVCVRSTIGRDLKVTVAHLHSDRDRSYCAFCRAHGGFDTTKTRRVVKNIQVKAHIYRRWVYLGFFRPNGPNRGVGKGGRVRSES